MKPLSEDIKGRVLAACDAGEPTAAVARRLTVSPAFVRRLKQRRREGTINRPRGKPGPRARLAAGTADGDRLAALARAEPDLSAGEFRDRLGLPLHPVTVWRALRRMGLTFKKKRSSPTSG